MAIRRIVCLLLITNSKKAPHRGNSLHKFLLVIANRTMVLHRDKILKKFQLLISSSTKVPHQEKTLQKLMLPITNIKKFLNREQNLQMIAPHHSRKLPEIIQILMKTKNFEILSPPRDNCKSIVSDKRTEAIMMNSIAFKGAHA